MDKDRKIEIQQKLIEELTAENKKLKETISQYNKLISNAKHSKEKYDGLIEELEQLKIDYYIQYDMYRKLTKK